MSRSRLDEQCAAAYASDAKAHKRVRDVRATAFPWFGFTNVRGELPKDARCPLCGQALPRLRKAEPWERNCLLCGGPRGS